MPTVTTRVSREKRLAGGKDLVAALAIPSHMATETRTVVVEHETGLHARPASVFVQTASEFDADISVQKVDDGAEVDAKSSIAVISLGVGPGEEIRIEAAGEDGAAAVDRLAELVENDFELDSAEA